MKVAWSLDIHEKKSVYDCHSPILFEDTIYAQYGEKIYSISEDGAINWQISFKNWDIEDFLKATPFGLLLTFKQTRNKKAELRLLDYNGKLKWNIRTVFPIKKDNLIIEDDMIVIIDTVITGKTNYAIIPTGAQLLEGYRILVKIDIKTGKLIETYQMNDHLSSRIKKIRNSYMCYMGPIFGDEEKEGLYLIDTKSNKERKLINMPIINLNSTHDFIITTSEDGEQYELTIWTGDSNRLNKVNNYPVLDSDFIVDGSRIYFIIPNKDSYSINFIDSNINNETLATFKTELEPLGFINGDNYLIVEDINDLLLFSKKDGHHHKYSVGETITGSPIEINNRIYFWTKNKLNCVNLSN